MFQNFSLKIPKLFWTNLVNESIYSNPDARSVTVIVVRNGHGDSSSNVGWGIFLGKVWIQLFSLQLTRWHDNRSRRRKTEYKPFVHPCQLGLCYILIMREESRLRINHMTASAYLYRCILLRDISDWWLDQGSVYNSCRKYWLHQCRWVRPNQQVPRIWQ